MRAEEGAGILLCGVVQKGSREGMTPGTPFPSPALNLSPRSLQATRDLRGGGAHSPSRPRLGGAVCPLLMLAAKEEANSEVKGLLSLKPLSSPLFYCSLGVSLCSDLFLKAYIGLFIISNTAKRLGEERNYPGSQSLVVATPPPALPKGVVSLLLASSFDK